MCTDITRHVVFYTHIDEIRQLFPSRCLMCVLFLLPVGGSAVGGGVVPVSDYSYSSPYSQYTTSYGTYGYGAGGLLSK
jgi:hypothetical protein